MRNILLAILMAVLIIGYVIAEIVGNLAETGKVSQRAFVARLGIVMGLMVTSGLIASCAPPTVLSTPNSCASLLPGEWKQGVAGAPLPSGDTVGDWVAFGDAQTGRLDMANGRTRDSIGIVERCEARDAAAVRRATRRWWQIF